jgi:hypothetical protein
MVQNIDEYSPNQLHERMGAPVKMCLEKEGSKGNPQARLALISSAPSTLRVAPEGVMRALRLACTIIEFGRVTEVEV